MPDQPKHQFVPIQSYMQQQKLDSKARKVNSSLRFLSPANYFFILIFNHTCKITSFSSPLRFEIFCEVEKLLVWEFTEDCVRMLQIIQSDPRIEFQLASNQTDLKFFAPAEDDCKCDKMPQG